MQYLRLIFRRPIDPALVGIGVAALCYVGFLLFRASLDFIVSLPSDDAFYYFEIARNIVEGHGCTFDGIAPTNGFHPLWLVCLLPVFWVFGPDLEMPVRVVASGNALLCLTTLFLVLRLTRKHIGARCGWLAVSICLLPNVLCAMINGMETGLLLFALVVLLWLCYQSQLHDPQAGGRKSFMFGVAIGVVTLCRLDSVFLLIAAVGIRTISMAVLRIPLRQCAVRVVAMCAGFALVFGPYVVWGYALFGHVMPISGALKSTFPAVQSSLRLKGDMPMGATLLAVLVVVAIATVLMERRKPDGVQRWLCSPLTLLTAACALHFLHEFLFIGWGIYWWHFSMYGLAVALAVAQFVDRAASRLSWVCPWGVRSLCAVVTIGAIALTVRVIEIKHDRHREWLAAAEWARANTTEDAVLAIKDAGLFGYFSDRRTINLDGKANGYDYRAYLERNDIDEYLRIAEVTYVADIHARYKSGICTIRIPRIGQEAALLSMRKLNEVYSSEPFAALASRWGKAPNASFVIWRYPGPHSTPSQ